MNRGNKDHFLFILVALSVINFLIMLLLGPESNIRYILLIFNILLACTCKKEHLLPLLFYTRPNFGLYDQIGFNYLFNIIIVIVALRLVLFHGKLKCINKKTVIWLLILFLYNMMLVLVNNIRLTSLYTYISLFLSYIILIIYSSDEDTDFKIIYKYYAVGMVMGVLCGLTIPYSMFGLNIPRGYRFSGLMRDSNGYSLDILLLIIGSFIYSKETKKNTLPIILILIVCGFLGTSKMFLISLSFTLLCELIINFNTISLNNVRIRNVIIILITIILAVYLNNRFNFLDSVKNNYIARFNATDLTSGRNRISNYYISLLFNNPLILLFGKSLDYYTIIGYDGWAMAHNTWLELFLSFGIFGTIIYFIFINRVVSIKQNRIKYKGQLFLATVIFFFCLGALPILSGDTLAILILYIVLIKNVGLSRRDKICYEKN